MEKHNPRRTVRQCWSRPSSWQSGRMRPMIFRVAFTLALLASSLSAATVSRISSTEGTLVKYIDLHNDEGLALLERVVNINSGTHNLAGVREVGRIFRAELDSIG